MNNISKDTRQISFEEIQDKKKKRYEQILNRLSNREMTAKEIAYEMYKLELIPEADRNYTAPRLNELEKTGDVKVISKRKCKWTGKMVSVYRKTTEEEKMCVLNANHIPSIY